MRKLIIIAAIVLGFIYWDDVKSWTVKTVNYVRGSELGQKTEMIIKDIDKQSPELK